VPDPISTSWLPISSKQGLKFYLEADRLALGRKSNSTTRRITDALGITSLIWRYLRFLRTAEYIHNYLLGNPRTCVYCDPYLVTEYPDPVIRKILEECKLEYQVLPDGALGSKSC